MAGRYEDVSENVLNVLKDVRDKWFPELASAKIKCLFDLKKRTSGGKVVIARIQKTNDLLRHLSVKEVDDEDGYDYIMYIDKKIWDNIPTEDKIRIVRHELRHTFVDLETESNPYKIIPHNIEDFVEEIELNKDDVDWGRRVAELGVHLYQQEREMDR